LRRSERRRTGGNEVDDEEEDLEFEGYGERQEALLHCEAGEKGEEAQETTRHLPAEAAATPNPRKAGLPRSQISWANASGPLLTGLTVSSIHLSPVYPESGFQNIHDHQHWA